MNFLIDRDPNAQIGYASLQSDIGRALCQQHHIPTDLNTMVLIQPKQNRVYTKSAAVLRVIASLGFPWSLLALLLIVPQFISDFCYSMFASVRIRLFGQKDACRRMTPDLRRRFLELTTFAKPNATDSSASNASPSSSDASRAHDSAAAARSKRES